MSKKVLIWISAIVAAVAIVIFYNYYTKFLKHKKAADKKVIDCKDYQNVKARRFTFTLPRKKQKELDELLALSTVEHKKYAAITDNVMIIVKFGSGESIAIEAMLLGLSVPFKSVKRDCLSVF